MAMKRPASDMSAPEHVPGPHIQCILCGLRHGLDADPILSTEGIRWAAHRRNSDGYRSEMPLGQVCFVCMRTKDNMAGPPHPSSEILRGQLLKTVFNVERELYIYSNLCWLNGGGDSVAEGRSTRF